MLLGIVDTGRTTGLTSLRRWSRSRSTRVTSQIPTSNTWSVWSPVGNLQIPHPKMKIGNRLGLLPAGFHF